MGGRTFRRANLTIFVGPLRDRKCTFFEIKVLPTKPSQL
ncbi:hypothetical protein BH10PSE7_BH10PSE7_05520 [soil metagenome]